MKLFLTFISVVLFHSIQQVGHLIFGEKYFSGRPYPLVISLQRILEIRTISNMLDIKYVQSFPYLLIVKYLQVITFQKSFSFIIFCTRYNSSNFKQKTHLGFRHCCGTPKLQTFLMEGYNILVIN